jgi:twinfilin-like protein
MARANLLLNEEIRSAFIAAQDNHSVRLLKIAVNNESLVLNGVLDGSGNGSAEDFNNLLNHNLSDNEASLVIFRMSEEGFSNSWLLIAWVPDGCRVRDKMLYSSSREDLKRGLGIGYFTAEYAANNKADINWNVLQEYLDKDKAKVFSELEVLANEEHVKPSE